MKYQILNEINPDYSIIETILFNRGIEKENAYSYLHTTDEDINSFLLLGEEALADAHAVLAEVIGTNQKCLVVVDSDCDGYTSAALLINYLYDRAPQWVEQHLETFIHNGKEHGLSDVEVSRDISLVIVPDAGSNDYEHHKALKDRGVNIIVLDHHEAEQISEDAIIINNQLSDYPNKSLSGVGVTWQFCRYLDSKAGTDFADQYIDLVALGLDADMMSLRSLETKHLINKGLEKDRVVNPFFFHMAEKNSFSLKGKLTPIGVAFYIAPLVNSMVRSGTQEEKQILFSSMLKHLAFERVPSTKRGHKDGDTERVVDQAIRIATNVKSRQTKAQNVGLEKLEGMIASQNLLDHKVLMFLCEPNTVPKNIGGLVANKFMAKYQRHTAILFRNGALWQGSARGCPKSIIDDFKELCAGLRPSDGETPVVKYAQGHPGAFGLGIEDENIAEFIRLTDEALADDSGEAIYYVDYIYGGNEVNGDHILDIAGLGHLWGQDMPEALIAIKGLKVTGDMVTLMSPDKNPTIKIALPNGISILKFKSSQKEYEKLATEGYVELNLVGTCNSNEWMGNISPQMFIKDYEIIDSDKYYF